MGYLLRVALRNVSRNRKRTVITLVAVVVGIFVIIFVNGLLTGLHRTFQDQVTRGLTGDLQLQRKGYRDAAESAPLNLDIAMDDALRTTLDQTPGIAAWSPRVRFGGLVSNGEDSAMFLGLAVDPVKEDAVSPRNRENVVEGTWLDPARPNGVVMSEQLAHSLHLEVGDEVTVLANTREGSLNGRDFQLVGLLSSRLPNASGRLVVVDSTVAAPMLFMEGRATEVALSLEDPKAAPEVAAHLEPSMSARPEPVVVYRWQELAPFFVDIMDMQDMIFGIVVAVLFLLVLTGIANTMLMSVFERTREIGTLMALGMRRRAVILLFLAEALVLGITGAVGGLLLGGTTVTLLGIHGILFTAPGTNGAPLTIYPVLSLNAVLIVAVFAIVCSLVSAFYPAWRASRLEPVAALRGA